MTREELEIVLLNLATDTAFRTAVTNDPIGTLALSGIDVTTDQVPAGGVVLPSRAAILAKATALSSEFHRNGCFTWQFHLIWAPGYVPET